MAELYTVNKVLRKQDAFDAVTRSMADQVQLIPSLKRGERPKDWNGEWEIEPFPSSHDPAIKEGQDKTDGYNVDVGFLLKGSLQIARSKGWKVTRESNLMPSVTEKSVGVSAAKAKAQDSRNLILSIERMLLSDQEVVEKVAADTVTKTRGMMSWLDKAAHAVHPIPTALRPADEFKGDVKTFTEADLKALISKAYRQINGQVSLIGYVGLGLKEIMSNFYAQVPVTQSMRDTLVRTAPANASEIKLVVDTFQYDGGIVRTVVSTNVNTDKASGFLPTDASHLSGAFIDPSMWRLQFLEEMTHIDQKDDGGGPRGFFQSILRLQCLNPMGQFRVVHAAA